MHILGYLPFAVLSITGPIFYFAALLPSVLAGRRKRLLAYMPRWRRSGVDPE